MNHVVCFVERSRNRHLFALELLRTGLIVEEVSGRFAFGGLACEQGELSVCEFYDLAGECLACLRALRLLSRLGLLPWLRGWLLGLRHLSRPLGLWGLPGLLRAVASLGSQARGRDTEGRRQNQREHLSRMRGSHFHNFVHDLFPVYLRLRFNDRVLSFGDSQGARKHFPLESVPPSEAWIGRRVACVFDVLQIGICVAEGYWGGGFTCLTYRSGLQPSWLVGARTQGFLPQRASSPGAPFALGWYGARRWRFLVEALEAGDEFFGEGFAGLGPEEAAGDAAVLFDGEGEGEELFDVLLNAFLRVFVEGFFL